VAESVAPTTTLEDDRRTSGQRRINIIWEVTQAFIATSITGAFIFAKLSGIETSALDNTFFMVVGFYFGRTNHARTGGIGGDRSGYER